MAHLTGHLGLLLSRLNVQAVFVSGEKDPLVNESISRARDHYFRGRYIYNNDGVPLEFQWHDTQGIPYLKVVDEDRRGAVPPWTPEKGPDVNYVFRLQENEVDLAKAAFHRCPAITPEGPEDQLYLKEGEMLSSKTSDHHDLNQNVPMLTMPGHAPIPNWVALFHEEKANKAKAQETYNLSLYQCYRAQSIQAPSKIPSLKSPGPVAIYYEKVTIAYPRNNLDPVKETVLRIRSADDKILGYKPLPENETTSVMRTHAQPNPVVRLPPAVARLTRPISPTGAQLFRYGAPPARSPSPLPVSTNPPQQMAPEILSWLAAAPFHHPIPETPLFPAGLTYWVSNGPDEQSYLIPLGMRDQWQRAMPKDAITTLPLEVEVPVHVALPPVVRRPSSTTQSEVNVRPVVMGGEQERTEELLGRGRERTAGLATWERGRERGHIRGSSRSETDLRGVYWKKN